MSRQIQDAYVVAAIRTPVVKAKGAFCHTRPDDLLGTVIQGVLAKVPAIQPHQIDDVIIGCAMPEAEQGMNVARIASLLGGLTESVPGLTINRFCSSGLQSISMAADRIALGEADIILAGGVESMSLVPMGGHHFSANLRYFEQREHIAIAYGMGITAEKVAQKWNISREAQDSFAFSSHQKAVLALQEKAFYDEILAIRVISTIPDLHTQCTVVTNEEVTQDQGPRKDCTREGLAKLRPIFARSGTVTAGNTSQMSDGAAVLILVSEKILTQYNLLPLARFKGFAVAGVPPEYMGIGPIKAIPKLLKQTGLKQNDIGWIELNEAFAAQSLAVIQEMGLILEQVNPLGGAIALGHPLGATGAILATKLIHGARKKKIKYGMVTMCVGTGMGAAGIFELL